MTIQSIEQALDGAIALLMYGSGAWLSYSLAAFVVTRSKASVNQDLLATQKSSARLASPQAAGPAFEAAVSKGSISIEVMPEATTAISTVETATESETTEPLQAVFPEPIAVELPLSSQSLVIQPTQPKTPSIVCEPVNWKKWKVGDLRESSITQVCGVRTSPIGSSRKLKKADLIAQYEQNLKRMTYELSEIAMQSEKIA